MPRGARRVGRGYWTACGSSSPRSRQVLPGPRARAHCATFSPMGEPDRPRTLLTRTFLASLPLADPYLRRELAAELIRTTDGLEDYVGPLHA